MSQLQLARFAVPKVLNCRKLKRHRDADVARISRALVDKWKAVVLKTNVS